MSNGVGELVGVFRVCTPERSTIALMRVWQMAGLKDNPKGSGLYLYSVPDMPCNQLGDQDLQLGPSWGLGVLIADKIAVEEEWPSLRCLYDTFT